MYIYEINLNTSLFTLTARIDNQILRHHATAQQLPGNACERKEKKKFPFGNFLPYYLLKHVPETE